MAFFANASGSGGTYIKYSPQTNGWFIGKDEFQLDAFGVDLSSAKSGWGMIQTGQAPMWVWDGPNGPAPRPSEGDYKRGGSIRMWLGPQRGWGEWSTNGSGPFEGLATIIAQAAANNVPAGAMAMFRYKGSRAEKRGQGTTRVPMFEFVGVEPMPEGGGTAQQASAPATSNPPTTGAKLAAPPTSGASNGGGLGFG